jgi:hypothetical protein
MHAKAYKNFKVGNPHNGMSIISYEMLGVLEQHSAKVRSAFELYLMFWSGTWPRLPAASKRFSTPERRSGSQDGVLATLSSL